jgi:hypothetical protein
MFGVAITEIVPLPCPLAGDTMIHDASEVADHGQVDVDPERFRPWLPPELPKLSDKVVGVTLQFAPAGLLAIVPFENE